MCNTEYHKSTVKSLAMMDHTKINFDLVVELITWIVNGDHGDLEVSTWAKGGRGRLLRVVLAK